LEETVMNTIRRILRSATVLTTLAAVLVAPAIDAPAAFAVRVPPPGLQNHSHAVPNPTPAITVGGMPGWQIVLIAVGAALVAAMLAVLADRMWATRHRRVTATGA
jgi:hypothetical protein